jgi:transglutaminase-like putative cysteine protease
MKYILSTVIVLVCSTASISQSVDLWQVLKGKYPDAPAVFVDRSEVLNIQVNGDSLEIFSDVSEEVLHLKEQSEMFSDKKVYGSHFSEVSALKAKTLVWDKNRYKAIDVSSFKKNSDQNRGIFYDDSYYYAFNFPAVGLRNRTQLQYRELQKDARFISGFVFASYLPQAKTSFTIKTTKDVELFYKVLNDEGNTITFNRTEKGNHVVYEWRAENVLALQNEDQSPSIRYFSPHVICHVKSYKTKAKTINVLSGVADLYNWYYGFIKDLNQENTPELVSVVEKIKQSSTSELALVKNVFYWVQKNIEYIAFEQGMRGFIPHHGSYVFEKRYGDCKDMANLIVNMLAIGKVKAFHTWIGTRDLPYRYSELPTPLVDNHMIATYISPDGQYYFLDATSDYTSFEYPSSMIQGKEALIAKGPLQYEVKQVPVMGKDKNVMTDSMFVSLDNNKIIGEGRSLLIGYPKVFAGYELDRAQETDIKKYVTKLLGKGNNKFLLDSYSISDLEDCDKPTSLKYTFRISDYFQQVGEEIYINLHLNKDHYNAIINTETRKAPKELDYKYEKHEYIELSIPKGYTVEYLPARATHDASLLGYDISYEIKDDKIIFSKKMAVNYLLMQPDDFERWNKAVKLVSEAYKESIILKKK